jgi:hypothetical protein
MTDNKKRMKEVVMPHTDDSCVLEPTQILPPSILFFIVAVDLFVMFNRLSYSKYLFKYIIL